MRRGLYAAVAALDDNPFRRLTRAWFDRKIPAT